MGLRWLRGRQVAAMLVTALIGGVVAEGLPPLPDPLTLDEALALADAPHPVLQLAESARQHVAAELADVEADSGARLSFEGGLVGVEPSHVTLDSSNNDSYARLVLRKRLSDFGYSEATRESVQRRIASRELRYLDARQRRRLDIMRRFFEVLLADLAYARDNEDMATAFVDVDKARDRGELGQVSDIRLLELEAVYQEARRRRFESQSRQRATRARLAIALNRPGELPANLVAPEEPDFAASLPDYEQLLEEVLANNPSLQALRAEVQSAEQALDAAAISHGPVLHGLMEGAVWNRPSLTRVPFSAGVVLELPILTGGERDAELAKARAGLQEARARLAQAELELRETALDLWLELDNLRIRKEEVDVLGDYRELYLDRSRALYELEVRTDLGDAMVQTSAVRYRRAETVFQRLLAEARLEALAGRLVGRDGEEMPRKEATR